MIDRFLKVMLILLLATFITLAIVGLGAEGKRRKLLAMWMEMAKERGRTLPDEYIMRQLRRLNYMELDTLERFTVALKEKRTLEAISMAPEVMAIMLRKTDLGIVQGALEIGT